VEQVAVLQQLDQAVLAHLPALADTGNGLAKLGMTHRHLQSHIADSAAVRADRIRLFLWLSFSH